jgi:hypothetical protein
MSQQSQNMDGSSGQYSALASASVIKAVPATPEDGLLTVRLFLATLHKGAKGTKTELWDRSVRRAPTGLRNVRNWWKPSASDEFGVHGFMGGGSALFPAYPGGCFPFAPQGWQFAALPAMREVGDGKLG